MDISERNLILRAIRTLSDQSVIPTRQAILRFITWENKDKDALCVLDELISSGDVVIAGESYILTPAGQRQTQRLFAKEFGEWMIACERSTAYRKFCRQVYGGDLCHFNMLTKTQLEKLFEVLQVSKGETVLDLGCGTGSITEYIADNTGATVMGIDFSGDAVEFAREKTRGKQDRLTFQIMDMNDLGLSPQSFDVILSIDTLYFVSDLRKTVETIKTSMKPNGRMGILYSVEVGADQSIDLLSSTETGLGKILTDCGLTFDTWDFTADDKEFWEKQLQIANELKIDFEMEGNRFIYDGRISEATEALRRVNTGRTRRYLYHVRL